MLKRGSRGLEVEHLQKCLNQLYPLDYPQLVRDGKFGPLTHQWVEKFQRMNGLKIDGIVGPNTSAKLAYKLPMSYPMKNFTPAPPGFDPQPEQTYTPVPAPTISHKRVVLLEGSIAPNAKINSKEETLIKVDANVPLATCISKVTFAAKKLLNEASSYQRLKALTIMAHGAYSGTHKDKLGDLLEFTPDFDEDGEGVGGYGVFIGNRALSLKTMYLVSEWRNLFEYIVLLSCGIAYTHPMNEGKIGDGQLFCKRMASSTDAKVIASDRIQTYMTNEMSSQIFGWEYSKTEATGIDFGKWEGQVYVFEPNGSMSKYKKSSFPKTDFL